MKHAARKTTSVLLSALLLGSSCLMGVSANTVSTDPVFLRRMAVLTSI